MKKSLIALAALAAVGAASAQSTVTLYGRVDASIGASKNTVTNVSTSQVFNGSAGGLTGSRWGMRGTEDLGGGLKAVFQLENRLSVDDGNDTGGFQGDAFVGLSGDFGTVHLGRTYTAFDGVKAVSVGSSVFDSAFTPNALPAYAVRAANQVKYVSPSYSGFTATVTSGLRESTLATAKNTNGVALAYSAGPLTLAAGAQKDAAGENRGLTGAYNLGVASVSVGYSTLNGANNGNDSKGINLGVNVPMGAFNFSVGYGSGDTETNAGAKVSEYSGVGLGATYSMSKRTRLYAGLKNENTENAAGTKLTGTRLYAVGVRHDF